MSRKTGYERLRTLYAILAGLPASRVDLENWRHASSWLQWPGDAELKKLDCGTAACSVGWASAYPAFRRVGLGFVDGHPIYRKKTGWDAVEAFFNVTEGEAEVLFMKTPSRYLSDPVLGSYSLDQRLGQRKRAMRRIRRFLMANGVISESRNAELAQQEGVPA